METFEQRMTRLRERTSVDKWKGPGSVAVKPTTWNIAMDVVSNVAYFDELQDIPVPFVSPGDDGSIAIRWSVVLGDKYIEIEIAPDGEIIYGEDCEHQWTSITSNANQQWCMLCPAARNTKTSMIDFDAQNVAERLKCLHRNDDISDTRGVDDWEQCEQREIAMLEDAAKLDVARDKINMERAEHRLALLTGPGGDLDGISATDLLSLGSWICKDSFEYLTGPGCDPCGNLGSGECADWCPLERSVKAEKRIMELEQIIQDALVYCNNVCLPPNYAVVEQLEQILSSANVKLPQSKAIAVAILEEMSI